MMTQQVLYLRYLRVLIYLLVMVRVLKEFRPIWRVFVGIFDWTSFTRRLQLSVIRTFVIEDFIIKN